MKYSEILITFKDFQRKDYSIRSDKGIMIEINDTYITFLSEGKFKSFNRTGIRKIEVFI